MKPIPGTFCLLALSVCARAQQQPPRRDSVVVTGTFDPLPLEEADRSVTLLPMPDDGVLPNSWGELMRLDPSVDLRRRAPAEVQADVSIRGGTFGQTLVLLNGLRLNDPQSGHHNMDVPVPLEAVSRIEILRGAGSAFYGSDAVGGAVNFITREPEASEMRLRVAGGSFGVNQQRGFLAVVGRRLSQQLSFSRDFSSGFMADRDYRNASLASITRLRSALGATDLVLAANDRPFGAAQFYGNFNSWERTGTRFASLRQSFGDRTEAAFSFRRHTDLFVLYRDRPEAFTNRHAAESWQGALRRRETLRGNARLHYGLEGYHDAIASNNLGRHSRGRAAGYAALDVRALRRFSFSVGAREEVYQALRRQLSPTLSGGVWLSRYVKLRANASRAFRLPSYTDLYYHDPASVGSPGLRPERASSYEAGMDWNAGARLRGQLTLFQRRERDGIDYLRRSPNDIWRAANLQKLRFTGLEASASVAASRAQRFEAAYVALHGAQAALSGLMSRYVFNYPVRAGTVSWRGSLPGGLLGQTRTGVTQRYGRGAYALWDVSLARAGGRWRPFLQLSNLSGTVYQEIPGVAMPGRSVLVGVEFVGWLH